MPNNQGVTNPSNHFCLSSQKSDCYYKNVEVDFTPALVLGSQNSIVPTFFNDHQFFTPAFILPRQRQYYYNTHEYEKYKFDALVLKASSSTAEGPKNRKAKMLNIGWPTSKFCQICKKHYEDYYEHINQIEHLSRIKRSTAYLYISEMVNKVNRRYNKRISKQKKGKGNKRGKEKTRNQAKLASQRAKKKKVNKKTIAKLPKTLATNTLS